MTIVQRIPQTLETILRKSTFTRYLIELNGLIFNKWIFEPGMLFKSEMKWWGDKGSRGHKHNGLDLRFYEANDGTIKTLDRDTKVPIIYAGMIVKVVKDFLGYSMFASHDIYEEDSQLFTIYGHVLPNPEVSIGSMLKGDSVIATISGDSAKKVPAHLHISLALIPKSMSAESLTWELPDRDKSVRFLDPKVII